jgi:hypothetical protein
VGDVLRQAQPHKISRRQTRDVIRVARNIALAYFPANFTTVQNCSMLQRTIRTIGLNDLLATILPVVMATYPLGRSVSNDRIASLINPMNNAFDRPG